MKEIEKMEIAYAGYNKPDTLEELELEILGLETAISAARQRIAVLKQSAKLQSLMNGELNEKTVSKASADQKTQ